MPAEGPRVLRVGPGRELASLEQARDEVRRLKTEAGLPPGGFVVEVAAGEYVLERPLSFQALDGGAPGASIVWKAAPGAAPVVSGGRRLHGFRPVEDEALLRRLPADARPHVRAVDLGALGIGDVGEPTRPGRRPELFWNGVPLTLARWPNRGFAEIAGVSGDDPVTVHGVEGDMSGRFHYEGSRPERWRDEPDPWLHGYWFWDWSDEPQRIASIDPAAQRIELSEPWHRYGYRRGARYYALNLLREESLP